LEIEKTNERKITENFKIYPIKQYELYNEGLEKEEGQMYASYVGNKWGGIYLRAPEVFFKILEKGKDKLVRLRDIADVKFGIKTGANEFFYLEPTGQPAPKGLLHVKNSAGWEGYIEEEFLKPVIKSPKELTTIIVKEEDLKYKVFMCHKSKEELKGTYALEYIEWGERQKTKGWQHKQKEGIDYTKIKSFEGRKHWYSLPIKIEPSNIFWWKIFGERHCIYFSRTPLYSDQTFYLIYPFNKNLTEYLLLSLNSTIQRFFNEIYGIVQTGSYAITEMTVEQVSNVLFIDPTFLTGGKIKDLLSYSIFEEIGFQKCNQKNCNHPEHPYENVKLEEVSFDRIMPDRRELDKIIFEVIGLTEEEQLEVYRTVVELVKNRLLKAKRV
jgi:hypothetical protein